MNQLGEDSFFVILSFMSMVDLQKVKPVCHHFENVANDIAESRLSIIQSKLISNVIEMEIPHKILFRANMSESFNILRSLIELNSRLFDCQIVQTKTYDPISGVCPFLKITTANGFHMLLSIMDRYHIVVDFMGGTCDRDRKYNMNKYVTKPKSSYVRLKTYDDLMELFDIIRCHTIRNDILI